MTSCHAGSRSLVLWERGGAETIVARVAIVGDFLPAGSITLPPGGWHKAGGALAEQLSDVSMVFVNLECVIDADGLAARSLDGIGQIVSTPRESLAYLEGIRAKAVGIANNHTYDFGSAGVGRTRGVLKSHNIAPLGAGRRLRDAPEIFVWHGPGNIRAGFWAAATVSHNLATQRSSGVEPATVERAKQAIGVMRSRGAKFAIALLHLGCQRTSRPDPADVKLADSIGRCGFNIVAASHSHRISGCKMLSAEEANPAFCFYGIGSVVSGYADSAIEKEGLIVIAGLDADGDLARVGIQPILLAETGLGEIPSPAEAQNILERFEDLSREIIDGSSARLFYRDMSDGLLQLYLRDVKAAFRESGIHGLARKAGRVRLRHLRRLVHGLAT